VRAWWRARAERGFAGTFVPAFLGLGKAADNACHGGWERQRCGVPWRCREGYPRCGRWETTMSRPSSGLVHVCHVVVAPTATPGSRTRLTRVAGATRVWLAIGRPAHLQPIRRVSRTSSRVRGRAIDSQERSGVKRVTHHRRLSACAFRGKPLQTPAAQRGSPEDDADSNRRSVHRTDPRQRQWRPITFQADPLRRQRGTKLFVSNALVPLCAWPTRVRNVIARGAAFSPRLGANADRTRP
jgi:hypothetical protein